MRKAQCMETNAVKMKDIASVKMDITDTNVCSVSLVLKIDFI